eukprot:2504835-Rhodomonas_salina.3
MLDYASPNYYCSCTGQFAFVLDCGCEIPLPPEPLLGLQRCKCYDYPNPSLLRFGPYCPTGQSLFFASSWP